jgi:phosphatidylserine decarboxylase
MMNFKSKNFEARIKEFVTTQVFFKRTVHQLFAENRRAYILMNYVL